MKKYAVVDVQEFYNDDNFKVIVVSLYDDIDEAKIAAKRLNGDNYYLSHNQATGIFKAALIVDNKADYQSWADSQDWERCPIEYPKSKEDNAVNYNWAEQKAIGRGKNIFIHFSSSDIVDNDIIVDFIPDI